MRASSKHLFPAVLLLNFILFSHSFAKLHETNPCNGNGLVQENETSGEGCHFAGECSGGPDCRQPCAALGRNPDAVKCVSSPAGNRCCCVGG
ncbi:hypothetical protein PTKIN_Ptkin05aG0075900 [Pterospermum kingtungense]